MVRELLCRMMKVPPEPVAPTGAPGSVRTFHAAPGFFYYRLIHWGLSQVGAAVGLVVGISFLRFVPNVNVLGIPLPTILGWIEVLTVAGFILQLPLGPLLVRMDYEMRWYIVTDRSLRIREGILRVREQTMTFHNIQNLAIQQGPLQRLFGIEDLKVRPAGGGESAGSEHGKHPTLGNMHEGFFRGVEDAGPIRDAILVNLKSRRDAGLGDPDREHHAAPGHPSPGDLSGLLLAARSLRDEAAALRRAMEAKR